MCVSVCVCVRVHACARARARARMCMCVCLRERVRVCVCASTPVFKPLSVSSRNKEKAHARERKRVKMSVIIRLQGLSWSASAMDIRTFFSGLTVRQGGVHIVGGPRGDAFIAFSGDEDARQALLRDGAVLCGSPVHLSLSSKAEMHNVISEARATDAMPAPTHSRPSAHGRFSRRCLDAGVMQVMENLKSHGI